MDENNPVAAPLSLGEALPGWQADSAKRAQAARTLLQEVTTLARTCLASWDEDAREEAISCVLLSWSRGRVRPDEGRERAYLARCLWNAAVTAHRKRYRKGRELPTGDDDEMLSSDEPSAVEQINERIDRETLSARFASAFDAYEAHLDGPSVRRDVAKMDRIVLTFHRRLVRRETTLEDWYDSVTRAETVERNTLQKRVSSFRVRFVAFLDDPACPLDREVSEASRVLIDRLRAFGSTSGPRVKGSSEGDP